MTDKTYRECMAEIVAVLERYDMAGAITIVAKNRAMFRYRFPTWGVIEQEKDHLRFRSRRADFESKDAWHEATELSVHVIMQFRDVAAQTFIMMQDIGNKIAEVVGVEHTPFAEFDPELDDEPEHKTEH